MTDTTLTEQARADLAAAVPGGVRFDLGTRGLYATDASHYQQTPAAVVTPADEADVLATLRVCHRHKLPVTPRGAATSLSGQTFGPGVVIDVSQHMEKVLQIDHENQTCCVQPGVVRDRLNERLKPHRLHFAPDPATGNRATVAGMIGNNSSGTRSIRYGKTSDHVLELKVALADGTVLTLGPESAEAWRQNSDGDSRGARIRSGLRQLVTQHADEIRTRFPKVMRRVAGYALDAFPLDPATPWDLCKLICGSEGTLAFILEAKLKLTPLPAATALCVVHFNDRIEALRHIERINAFDPAAVELLDHVVLREARRNPATKAIADFFTGDPAAVLIVEFFGIDPCDAQQKAEHFAATLARENIGYAHVIRTDPAHQQNVWNTRKLGLGLISNVAGPVKGQACVEDACVPLPHLAEYIDRLATLCDSLGVACTMYAHASVGVIHFRPMLDLHRDDHRDKMRCITEQAFEWCRAFGGCFSGEHGDGLLRGQFIRPFFGDTLYEAFRQTKALFDPDNLMNPGKIVDAPAMLDPKLLRYGEHYRVAEIPSAFRHDDQGGFRLAVEQCNGVGACRKVGAGTMCPSYMATRDERDTTRGRANLLRLAMSGQLGREPLDALAGDAVADVLSLCLSCKACKQECPNSVDMSRLKADAMHLRHQRHGVPLGHRAVANLPALAACFAGPLAPAVHALQAAAPMRWLNEKLLGVDRRRQPPRFARRTLEQLLKQRTSTSRARQQAVSGDRDRLLTRAARDMRSPSGDTSGGASGGGGVSEGSKGTLVLFDDTYMRYFEPQVGLRTLDVLEAMGYDVILARAGCCQRPAISKGMLDLAAARGGRTVAQLDRFAQAGLTILVTEPSCASALTDDLPDLIADKPAGQRVAAQVKLLDVFLADHLAELQTAGVRCAAPKLLVHGHCHEKALYGMQTLEAVLAATGAEVKLIDAGCCGMAGSFGYEHYDVSRQIAEDRLLPALREHDASWTLAAPGVSCRHQIADLAGAGGGRTARHWVELLEVHR